jgi:hypothetical protein
MSDDHEERFRQDEEMREGSARIETRLARMIAQHENGRDACPGKE